MREDFFKKFEQITAPYCPYCFQNGSSLADLIVINQFTFWDRALVAYADQLVCKIFEKDHD